MRGENEGALGYLSREEPSNGKSGQGLPTEKAGGQVDMWCGNYRPYSNAKTKAKKVFL